MNAVLYDGYSPQIEIQSDGVTASSKLLTNNVSPLVKLKCSSLLPNNITVRKLSDWLESRCPSRNRADIEYLLRANDLRDYNPFWICRKSHGVTMTDNLWLRFDDEVIDYDSVKLRH